MKENIVIFSTCGSVDEARKIAHSLVEDRLAACVQIVPGIESTYRWDGRVENSKECQVIIKTAATMFDQINARIHEMHSYETPEVVALAVSAGSSKYLSWMEDEVGG